MQAPPVLLALTPHWDSVKKPKSHQFSRVNSSLGPYEVEVNIVCVYPSPSSVKKIHSHTHSRKEILPIYTISVLRVGSWPTTKYVPWDLGSPEDWIAT